MSNTQTTPTSGTATGLSVATGSVSVDIAEKIITAIEGRFRDWLMHGEHTEAKELVTDILERELDGWAVKADDYDRLSEAAIWLRRSCKDRLPVGHYAKLDEECRAIDAALCANGPAPWALCSGVWLAGRGIYARKYNPEKLARA